MTGLIRVGAEVRTVRGKTRWKVTELSDRHAHVTKIDADGNVAGYVNQTFAIANLVLVERAA